MGIKEAESLGARDEATLGSGMGRGDTEEREASEASEEDQETHTAIKVITPFSRLARDVQRDAIALLEATLSQARAGNLAGLTLIVHLRDSDEFLQSHSWEKDRDCLAALSYAFLGHGK